MIPADTTPPQVVAARLVRASKGRNKKISGIELTFSEPLARRRSSPAT